MSDSGSKKRRWLIFGGAFTGIVIVGVTIFFTIGQWLVVDDPLAHADVIVVLSGNLPDRAQEVARLYHAGYADHIWISQPISPAAELKKMKIFYLGEDFYNEKILLALGVPGDAIRVLEIPSANTEEETREISDTMHRDDLHSAIIVTSKPHTRRVRTIWRTRAGSDLRVIVRHPDDDSYDGAHWWRHTHDALDIVRETLGLANAWAGFPVRPSQN